MAIEAISPALGRPRVLIFAPLNGSDRIQRAVSAAGYEIVGGGLCRPSSPQLRSILFNVDVVLIDVTTSTQDILNAVQGLNSEAVICGGRARILCFSTAHRNPRFVLELEKRGARYSRINTPSMLLEAIDLLLAQEAEFQRSGPCFRIVHRFSRGYCCAPGEEISAIQLAHHGGIFQLPLPLAQRFVFNFVAEHRQTAMDSSQIVSGLSDWFYREHAGNSGVRQITRIRIATVKVLMQRIRGAMKSTFASAQVRWDPHDVLRSFPAEGTRRVLYRLRSDVQWDHR